MELEAVMRLAAALAGVLALIALAAFAVRRLGLVPALSARGKGTRRLSVVESMALDARRTLMIIRRDDREHLVILGPSGETLIEGGLPALAAVSEAKS